MENQNI